MGERKLTRSQRKRMRKRKLKESAAAGAHLQQRRKIIGPVLPSKYLPGEGSGSLGREKISES